jgi:hypothetical protein
MTGQPKMPSLEDLVKSAQSRRPSGSRCWVFTLPKPALEYLDALHRIESERPMAVNRAQVRRDLSQYFGVDVDISTVKRHFAKECQCVWP